MTTPTDPGRETQLVDVRGRNVVIRELVDVQLLVLAREARLAQNPETTNERRLIAIGRIFDILESAIVQEVDREYVLDLTVQGNITLADLIGFINAFDPEAKPKVRRGRAAAKRT